MKKGGQGKTYLCGMLVKFENIFGKCQDLSSFEGRRLTAANGESLYDDVHITSQDRVLIHSYVDMAVSTLQSSARYAITDIMQSENGEDIYIDLAPSNALDSGEKNIKLIEETIATFIMWKWLEDKGVERANAYKSMFENMLASFMRIAYRKHAPNLDDYED